MQEFLKNYSLIIIICLSVLSLIQLVIILVDQLYIKKQLHEKIKTLEEKLHDWTVWFNQNSKQKKGNQNVTMQQEKSSRSFDNQICPQMSTMTTENSDNSLSDCRTTQLQSTVITEPQTPTRIYNYLQEANKGKFIKLLQTPEKCFFRTWEDGGIRRYEFYGNVDKALANINAIFDDVCDIEGKRSGASDIENISAGTLDSELNIISKAKIRLK